MSEQTDMNSHRRPREDLLHDDVLTDRDARQVALSNPSRASLGSHLLGEPAGLVT
jgi:hypothetical protein